MRRSFISNKSEHPRKHTKSKSKHPMIGTAIRRKRATIKRKGL